ncbi:YdeI family protein [Propionicimonas sp.]|uniref:YdeI/OmpD-associated family protein n=1 Tax=Propionicimonas sp. TaxID=1955623 RepID=UPI00180AC3C8|nr:YdeI/OmpD-associated family protein [Propionicimonas sp.]MBU3976240.1 YdeI/OmpD-associated family protein [Actinomycetota bacterium]MBA3021052.1 hypothetical protein [Propionicimonas sp.]MBU3985635.1 YdeI/OmpD-associated family protein [Actinomycetota bacterium]MBU4008420.1 YdeI/OmpD-associated family protein [Actinomycetota bacterium]MBU4066430.1 YdeI/OmpD-associated family protein [Actinomycetota bacterium]
MGMAQAHRLSVETIQDWHQWLSLHHGESEGVWVVLWRPSTGQPHPSYDELIREALCWGWIDGQSKPLDDTRSMLWFTRRRPNSPWAATNKARVAELAAEGRLQPAGIAEIERAKADGRWTLLDAAEALIVPEDLSAALAADPAARQEWDSFPPSQRKQALGWIATAKRPETRERRIAAIAAKAARGERPF